MRNIIPQKKLTSVYPCGYGNSSSTSILTLEQLMLFLILLRFKLFKDSDLYKDQRTHYKLVYDPRILTQ